MQMKLLADRKRMHYPHCYKRHKIDYKNIWAYKFAENSRHVIALFSSLLWRQFSVRKTLILQFCNKKDHIFKGNKFLSSSDNWLFIRSQKKTPKHLAVCFCDNLHFSSEDDHQYSPCTNWVLDLCKTVNIVSILGPI